MKRIACVLLACYAGSAYAEMDGVGFLIAFLVIGVVVLGYPWLSMLLGMLINRKLISKGYSNTVATVVGLGTTLTLLSIPFLDYPYKRMQINDYCAMDGGFHISRTVSGVEGIFGLPNATRYGYKYGEAYWFESDKNSLHRIYAEDVKPRTVSIVSPTTYGYRMNRKLVENSLYRVDLQTYVTDTGEELGRFVYFENEPTYFRPWMKMSCESMNGNSYYKFIPELLQRTLQPANK